MRRHLRPLTILTALAHLGGCVAQSTTTGSASGACPTVLTPSYENPVVGGGYTAQLIVKGLAKPRGLVVDSKGALLVVQQGLGIVHISLNDRGGTCVLPEKVTPLLLDDGLNHAIELSGDGRTLYASSAEEVFRWDYDPVAVSLSKNKQTLVRNMSNPDHVSRTLLLSKKQPDLLLVSRGSGENIDKTTGDLSSGRSMIRAFNITNATADKPYDYPSQGALLGWGLRNSAGVAEEPVTGGIYSVENSADMVKRSGSDIHTDNPGEEMNFHGFLNGSTENQGGNYGYPNCFALWKTNVPHAGDMAVGDQFSLDPDSDMTDEKCAKDFVAPRLTFQAHMAPLDIKFSKDGKLAYITFHGSWNRDKPIGYKLSVVSFANGEPTEPPDSTKAVTDILSNPSTTACPAGCFRPVGLAMDGQGRIYMTSDSTGEIYVLRQAEMTATGTGTSSDGGTLVTSTSGSSSNAAAGLYMVRAEGWLFVVLTVALSIVGGVFIITA